VNENSVAPFGSAQGRALWDLLRLSLFPSAGSGRHPQADFFRRFPTVEVVTASNNFRADRVESFLAGLMAEGLEDCAVTRKDIPQ
jgi:hypothetical protein